MSGLLLVELAAVDRFHRAVVFPYLLGFARSRGVSARWLRFGVEAARRFLTAEESGVGLEEGELATLAEVAAELRPRVALFNMEPAPSVEAAIRQQSPGVELEIMGETYAAGAGSPSRLRRARQDLREWARLLGRDDEAAEGPYYLAVEPDFGYEPGNPAARTMQPLPFVVLGRECTYDRPLRRNPSYDGVDLSGCVRRGGCAFCARPDELGPPPPFSLDAARRQLEALARTVPRPPRRLAIRLLGEPASRHVEELASICREVPLPPADLLLDSRADRLSRREAAMSAAAAALAGTGHRLHLCLVGVESFSEDELCRLNKGVTASDNLDAVAALLRLERSHPETFAFREHGGLSLILHTPWTTWDDLATNLLVIRECGLEGLCGKLLGARLRLEPGLPVTALARRDGLLVERYDDPALDTAARNLYGPELPWRSREPGMDGLCRVLVRLDTDTPELDDPLSQEVSRVRRQSERRGWSRLDLAIALVEHLRGPAARRRSDDPTAEQIVDGFERRLRSLPPSWSPTSQESWKEPDGATAPATDDVRLLAELTRRGIKPVGLIEPVRHNDVEALVGQYQPPNPRTRVRPVAGESPSVELFFGGVAERVERAVELTGAMERTKDPARFAAVIGELGALFGYPSCCVAAYAGEPPRSREAYPWLHLARRMATPGAVTPEINPCTNLLCGSYVPCRLDCPASLDLLRRVREVAGEVDAAWVPLRDARSRNPWLISLEVQGDQLELIPEHEVGDRWRYRPGLRVGRGPDIVAAAEADEIVVEGSSMILLRRGLRRADLSVRAFIWWHERALRGDLWGRVLGLRDQLSLDAVGREGRGLVPSPRTAELWELLEAALAAAVRRGVGLGHDHEAELSLVAADRLSLVLTPKGRAGGSEAAVTLNVQHVDEGAPSLFTIGPLAFSFPNDRPGMSSRGRAAVRDLARFLTRWLREHGRDARPSVRR